MKILIGLIGEAPHDTGAIAALLNQKFADYVEFTVLLKDVRGSQLDTQPVKHRLRKEFEDIKPQIVLFIRDLDGLKHEKEKLTIRKNYFSQSNNVINKQGIFLLNIYALEALILADIEGYIQYLRENENLITNIQPVLSPMDVEHPELFLKTHSKYKESQCPEIFGILRFDVVRQNCPYFADFIQEFESRIA